MASSYVNDLRLNELATGDASGTWGTTTNTNLELIGEALSYGTEGITTNANTHTTTVADGAADPGRAMYLEYTGTLDSACTITISPNTISRMHFIENGTSGSQNIIIKQGSGATITIPPGDTKAVYLDGAGSGAKVVDAFASLNVVDLKVQDDLTVTDDVVIGGDLGVTGAIAGTLSTAAQTNITSVGTLTALTVDNINVNGHTITSDTHLALDIVGDLQIDVDGAEVKLADGGTQFGVLFNSSSDFVIQSSVNDKDMLFKGQDGGSVITALKLDMSVAGKAIFNAGASFQDHVFLGDNDKLILGGGDDLQIYHDGSNSYIDEVGTGILFIRSNDVRLMKADGSETMLQADDDGAVNLFHNNAVKLATASGGVTVTGEVAATSLDISGDIDVDGTTNLDVVDVDGAANFAADVTLGGDILATDFDVNASGDINLDAGGGDWRLKDDGTTITTISNVSGDLQILLGTQDKDFKFQGNDGGSQITALTLDMSDAGTAIFNHDAVFGDNDRILLGNSSDLQILHDGSNSYIASNTGDFLIDSAGDIVLDAAGDDIRFKDNGTQSFVFTQGTGSTMSAPRGNLTLDVAGDILLDSGNGYVKLQDGGTEYGNLYESSNRLVIQAMVNNSALLFSGIDGGTGFTAMAMDMSDQGVATFNRGIRFNNDTAAANELDDYEEGTFTPSNEGGTTGGFGSPTGTYIKIGKQITCDFRFETTGGVSGGLNYRVLRSFPYAMYQNDYIGLLGGVSAYNLDQYMGGYIISGSSSNAIDFFVAWHQNSSGGTRIRCSVTYRTV